MEFVRGLGPSRNLILALPRPRSTRLPTPALLNGFAHRQLNTSSSQHATADPTKPIVLEKPDKFRPPSHPQRLNRRAPRNYPGPALSEPEREAQKTRRYPHTFPNPGTKLHWFLTTWWIHLCITMVSLHPRSCYCVFTDNCRARSRSSRSSPLPRPSCTPPHSGISFPRFAVCLFTLSPTCPNGFLS